MKPPFLVFLSGCQVRTFQSSYFHVHAAASGGGASSARCAQSLRSLILNMLSAPWYTAKRGVAHRSKCLQANRMLMGFCTCGRCIWPIREGCKRKHTLRTSHSLKIRQCLNSVRIRTVIQGRFPGHSQEPQESRESSDDVSLVGSDSLLRACLWASSAPLSSLTGA